MNCRVSHAGLGWGDERQTLGTTLGSILKLINYSRSSYPTRASYSGQVNGLRNPMKTELKTTCVWKPFQTRVIHKSRKTHDDKHLF